MPSRLRRSLAGVVVAALLAGLGQVHAQGDGESAAALDLFDEAAYHLAFYVGPAEVRPRDLVPRERARLEARCAEPAGCSTDDALGALEALIGELDDGHTGLIAPDRFDRLRLQLGGGGEVVSFGAVLRQPTAGLGLVVIDVVPGSAAANAGLARGDRVMALNGDYLPADRRARTGAWSDAEAEGEARLLVLRAGEAPFELDLRATPVALDRAPSMTLLEGDVAWIRIPSFLRTGVAQEVHDLVRSAAAGGASHLVVDVRDNPGGRLVECLAAAGAFADAFAYGVRASLVPQTLRWEGGVLSIIDPTGRAFPQSLVEEPTRWDGPAAMLVNGGSASCAEQIAYAVQRYAGVPVVGETTSGVLDSATSFAALSNGMGIAVTTARISDAEGVVLPAVVTPDHAIADDLMALADGRDEVLRGAIDLLLGR